MRSIHEILPTTARMERRVRLQESADDVAAALWRALQSWEEREDGRTFTELPTAGQERFRRAAMASIAGLFGLTDSRARRRTVRWAELSHDADDNLLATRTLIREVAEAAVSNYDYELARVFAEEAR